MPESLWDIVDDLFLYFIIKVFVFNGVLALS